jgi:hypothetical protein
MPACNEPMIARIDRATNQEGAGLHPAPLMDFCNMRWRNTVAILREIIRDDGIRSKRFGSINFDLIQIYSPLAQCPTPSVE